MGKQSHADKGIPAALTGPAQHLVGEVKPDRLRLRLSSALPLRSDPVLIDTALPPPSVLMVQGVSGRVGLPHALAGRPFPDSHCSPTCILQDTFGRIERPHAVSGSNLFKYAEPCHGLVRGGDSAISGGGEEAALHSDSSESFASPTTHPSLSCPPPAGPI